MSWIYSFLVFWCAVFHVKCNRPRLPSVTASMTPQIIRDRLEHLHCEKWRYHPGPWTAKRFNPDPREESESEMWQ
jgi:hypothetical protein